MNNDSTFTADPVVLAGPAARGRRPEFTGDPMMERLFSITLALTAELAVTRERLDTVERALARRDVMPQSVVETFQPNETDRRERGEFQAAFLARVFRSLLQDQGTATPVAVAADPGLEQTGATQEERHHG